VGDSIRLSRHLLTRFGWNKWQSVLVSLSFDYGQLFGFSITKPSACAALFSSASAETKISGESPREILSLFASKAAAN